MPCITSARIGCITRLQSGISIIVDNGFWEFGLVVVDKYWSICVRLIDYFLNQQKSGATLEIAYYHLDCAKQILVSRA